jgi:monoamine oxidase
MSSTQGKGIATSHQARRADVVVIGAGLAGLAVARGLVASSRSVAVLEARDRVGGRLLNHHLGDGRVTFGRWMGRPPARSRALGGRRVLPVLERLHGRRGPLGRARRQ